MKTLMIILSGLALAGCVTAGSGIPTGLGLSNGDIIKQDLVNPNRTNVYSINGRLKMYWKRDYLFHNQLNVFDNNGNRKAYIRPDYLNPKQYRVYK
jgi:hypothetical protein